MLNISPRGNRILVKILPEPTEQTTGAGVILPNGAQDVKRAVIVELGPDANETARAAADPVDLRTLLKVGSVILVQPFGGVKVFRDGEELQLMTARDALAVIEEVVDAAPALAGS